LFLDSINIKILNAGAWSRASERIPVSLPTDVSKLVMMMMMMMIYDYDYYGDDDDI
jgi:hypothetical protein